MLGRAGALTAFLHFINLIKYITAIDWLSFTIAYSWVEILLQLDLSLRFHVAMPYLLVWGLWLDLRKFCLVSDLGMIFGNLSQLILWNFWLDGIALEISFWLFKITAVWLISFIILILINGLLFTCNLHVVSADSFTLENGLSLGRVFWRAHDWGDNVIRNIALAIFIEVYFFVIKTGLCFGVSSECHCLFRILEKLVLSSGNLVGVRVGIVQRWALQKLCPIRIS